MASIGALIRYTGADTPPVERLKGYGGAAGALVVEFARCDPLISAIIPGLTFGACEAALTTPLITVSPVIVPLPSTNITGTFTVDGIASGDWKTIVAR